MAPDPGNRRRRSACSFSRVRNLPALPGEYFALTPAMLPCHAGTRTQAVGQGSILTGSAAVGA